MTKIIIEFVYPPIPMRHCDWSAHFDGDEERADLIGWGATEAEALADLARIHEERREALEEDDDYDEQWYEDQQRIRDAREGFDND